MKRGTIEHPKTAMLGGLLRVRLLEAVGVLESLWHWAAKYAPRGDIGRFPDEVIATGIKWHGKPDTLIKALLEAKGCGRYGWLEPHTQYRLVIHDWPEHADNSVEKWLADHDETFWDGSRPWSKRTRKAKQTESQRGSNSVTTEASQPEPEPEPEPEPITPIVPNGDTRADQIRAVFAHYRTHHPRCFPNPQPDSKEWKAIAARLKEGSTVDELKAAIDGMHRTPHNIGQNATGQKYLGLELCMRNGSQVSRFKEAPELVQEADMPPENPAIPPKPRYAGDPL